MPQPALEQHDAARFGRHEDPGSVRRAAVRATGGSGHESSEARILELQARCPAWRGDVIRSADRGQWVEVQTVRNVPGHDVHPAVCHFQRPLFEVELERAGEGANVPVQGSLESCERR